MSSNIARGPLSSFLLLLALLSTSGVLSQKCQWQQRADYKIDVDMNVKTNRFNGHESIIYYNNSTDTLNRLFFHLYWNAFQPGSSMDVRSRQAGDKIIMVRKDSTVVRDWDPRVRDRIDSLKPDEIGYLKVRDLRVNGEIQKTLLHETILEVVLSHPILPLSHCEIALNFESQVPVQIRRSGRDNAEGVRYSMSQWYPKLAEYDYEGWHPDAYIGREFYGVWGQFDVKIAIDSSYMVAGSGILQNASEIGKGYAPKKVSEIAPLSKFSWHFVADNVHDFVWAADPQYRHLSYRVRKDLVLHVFYKDHHDPVQDSLWNAVLWTAREILPFLEHKFGAYPYGQYSFIQGGDGGMEYPMATLLKNAGIGGALHEWLHSWYQNMLGTNESERPWMDEGFTTWAEGEASAYYAKNLLQKNPWLSAASKENEASRYKRLEDDFPAWHSDSYNGYFMMQKLRYEEPLSTYADHYLTNFGYEESAYSKGSVFLSQLGYIVSDKIRDKILLAYYHDWRFRHPDDNDFIRVAEKVSGMNLQWYRQYWIYSTKSIDYGIGDINEQDGKTYILIHRIGNMPMPLDVLLTFKDGSQELHYIPLDLMYGGKPSETTNSKILRFVEKEWRWVLRDYSFSTNRNINELRSIEIDPSGRMADINRANNKLVIPE